MESLSRGTGALTCIMLLVSVMIYKELRTILHPSISLLLLSLMLFTTGITTILQEGDVCENTGFLLFIASLAMMVYAAVRMCIFAVKSSLHRKETNI